MKDSIKRAIPPALLKPVSKAKWDFIARFRAFTRRVDAAFARALQRLLGAMGYSVARKKDYYSPLPSIDDLKRNYDRWFRPSALRGIEYDLEDMKRQLKEMLSLYYEECTKLPSYEQIRKTFGPGYTPLDGIVLYMMIRYKKPRRYIEVGSGMSTYYCSLAAEKNALEGHPLEITCIEPYPYDKLRTIPGVEVIPQEVQSVDLSLFSKLEEGDVFFIDSTHILRIDGDVPYLFLDVVPALKPGVIIHVHDIPFPYNVPYPPQMWMLNAVWPVFWNEAMILQAFLSFNDRFKITLSVPMLRHFDEDFLKKNIPVYETTEQNPNAFSSIWLKRIS